MRASEFKVESTVEQIFAECVSNLSCTEPLFVYDTVKKVRQGLKCGVAGGPDMTTYEHLKYVSSFLQSF